MTRWVVVSLCGVAVLIGVFALTVPKQLRLAKLSPGELGQKTPRPPEPPDDRCPKAQRILEDSTEPVRLQRSLTTDEAAIYASLIEHWNKQRTPLNLSRRTIPLYRNISDCDCLKDIDFESLTRASRSFRFLPRSISSKFIRLVDEDSQIALVQTSDPENTIRAGGSVDAAVSEAFANGLFEVSEIAFDKTGQKAIVSYSFRCGQLCGNGGVRSFEKVNGAWKQAQQTCGGWMS